MNVYIQVVHDKHLIPSLCHREERSDVAICSSKIDEIRTDGLFVLATYHYFIQLPEAGGA